MTKFELTDAERARVEPAIKGEFGWVDIDEHGDFWGKWFNPDRRGMRYGYLVRAERGVIWVVDCTPDSGDVIVARV